MSIIELFNKPSYQYSIIDAFIIIVLTFSIIIFVYQLANIIHKIFKIFKRKK